MWMICEYRKCIEDDDHVNVELYETFWEVSGNIYIFM